MAEEKAPDARRGRPPMSPRQSMTRTLMFMMFFLTLFVLIDPNLRSVFGTAAGAVFNPTLGMGAAYPVITILIAGTLTTIVSSIVRHVFTDWVKMMRMNKEMAALRKAQMEALRRGNPGKVQKIREIQVQRQAGYMDVQFAPMKSMAFTFLLFIVIFTWLGTFVYVDVVDAGRLYFAVPWQPDVSLHAAYVFPAWILLYSLLAIPIGSVVTRLLKYFQFQKRLATRGGEASG